MKWTVLASSPGFEHNLGAVAQQVEGLAVGGELVRMRHRLAQRGNRELRLRLGLHVRIDPQDRCDQQLLDQRVLQRAVVRGHRRLVAVGPPETTRAVLRFRLAAEPAEDRLLDVAVLRSWRGCL